MLPHLYRIYRGLRRHELHVGGDVVEVSPDGCRPDAGLPLSTDPQLELHVVVLAERLVVAPVGLQHRDLGQCTGLSLTGSKALPQLTLDLPRVLPQGREGWPPRASAAFLPPHPERRRAMHR
ncbi:MAG: hypothetical protein Q8P31_01410 [Bacillota bacterium]|nr:hypothetical protein [Bacillota bacterium]